MKTVRMKVIDNTGSEVTVGEDKFAVVDGHVEVPQSAVAELKRRGFTPGKAAAKKRK